MVGKPGESLDGAVLRNPGHDDIYMRHRTGF
jgi:hypothetical protein